MKKKIAEINKLFDEAVRIVSEQETQPRMNTSMLRQAADDLAEVIYLKSNLIEPFILLSYIFFLIREEKLSLKYLRAAARINNNHPKLNELTKLIMSVKKV